MKYKLFKVENIIKSKIQLQKIQLTQLQKHSAAKVQYTMWCDRYWVMVYWAAELLHITGGLKWHASKYCTCSNNSSTSVSSGLRRWLSSIVTALGKKLCFTLFVCVRLPDRWSSNRWCPGCVMSFMMFVDLLTQRVLWRCSGDGSSMPTCHNMLEGFFVGIGAAAVPGCHAVC